MNWTVTCAAIIPCWNEAATIAGVVRRVRSRLARVIVVDDGSTDGTADEATAAGARVLRHDRNRGKGAALRTGLNAALEAGCRWGLTLDADGQHPPECIPVLLRCAEETAAALVIGNRFANPGAMPLGRRLVNQWMSRQLSRRAGVTLPDSQCGFRLLHLDRWAQLPLTTEHFEFESEVLLAFVAAGAPVRFAPVPAIPAPRPSRIRFAADAWRWLRWWRASRSRPAVAKPADTRLATE